MKQHSKYSLKNKVPTPQLFNLNNQIAVVTGCMGLLGPIWSLGLLEAGAKVVGIDLPGSKISDRFNKLTKEYGNDKIKFYKADILDKSSLKKTLLQIKKDFGIPTILLNNAGIDQPPSTTTKNYYLEDIPIEISRKIFDVNVLGTFNMIQVFGSEMKKLGQGSIINIASHYAIVVPDPDFYKHIKTNPPFLKPIMYGPSKAAVIALTKRMAVEWGPYNIRVNSISPGGLFNHQDPKFLKKYEQKVPLGRMGIDHELIGPLIFLASKASSYVTGFNLVIDGGFTNL